MSSDEDRLGESIQVEGHALPAAAGALVDGDDGRSYYLGGVGSWSTDMIGQRVVVSGVLRLRPAPVQRRPPHQEQSHGLTDDTLVIDDPQWELAE